MSNKTKYLCVGKEEVVLPAWAEEFTLGELYELGPSPCPKEDEEDGYLYLKSDNGLCMFVEASQFEEYPVCTEAEQSFWDIFIKLSAIAFLSVLFGTLAGLLIRNIF